MWNKIIIYALVNSAVTFYNFAEEKYFFFISIFVYGNLKKNNLLPDGQLYPLKNIYQKISFVKNADNRKKL